MERKQEIKFNIFNFMDIDDLNGLVDDECILEETPENVEYEFKGITKDGKVCVLATFDN